jgi:glycosyltransferase involved in cell wall biosynthesis
MAAGRPVLYIGPRRATPAQIIEEFRCGWRIDPGDANSLLALLDLLARDPQLIARAGERARAAFESRFDLDSGVSRIVNILGLAAAPEPNFTERTQFVPSTLP